MSCEPGVLEPRAAPERPATATDAWRISGARRWTAVAVLTLVGVLNYVDRFLPSILAELIKHDLRLSDTALGFINGFGFLVVYAIVGIPIARVADRGRYGVVIGACLGLWSMMTMLGALTQSSWQLALTRMGVAIGEAGSTPAAHAFISRSFPPDRRAAPLAMLSLSVPLAGMAGLLGGGLIGEALGWRRTFLVMGGVSLVFAPIILRVLGAGGRAAARPAPSQPQAWRSQLTLLKKKSFLLVLAASSCIGVAGYTLVAFTPAFLMRAHGLSVGEVGAQYGIASGLVGMVGLVVAGRLADGLSRKDPRWLLWVVAAMAVLLLPCAVAGVLVEDRRAAIALLAVAYVVASAYLPPVVAALQRLAPVELRASASALLLFAVALMGGLGPLVTGMVSDALQPRLAAAALGRAMLLVPAAYLLAAIGFVLAARRFTAEVVDET